MRYLIGIDEAGRGPLAGPVAVGAVMVAHDFNFNIVKGVRDSKKLTAFARAYWYWRLHELERSGQLRFAVAFSSARSIDTKGIVPSIRSALARCLEKLEQVSKESPWKIQGLSLESVATVRLDGNLKAPPHFRDQTTIIRGDESEPIISLASIAAKVSRDCLMRRLSARYPAYGFDRHKGYGTREHRELIVQNGFCDIHRTTFCRNIIPSMDLTG